MDFIEKQIPPPKSWEKFEDLTRALFAAIWAYPLAQKNGRSGQAQHGVDVYGTPAYTLGKTAGVQCKGKIEGYGAKATTAEFDAELTKADTFKPSLGHWIFVTTASNDAVLQEHARVISEQRVQEGKFPVLAMGWDTIQALLSSHPPVIEEFYPEYAGDLPRIMAILRALPTANELDQIQKSLMAFTPKTSAPDTDAPVWSEVKFEMARDLGPALMGRPLGPADVIACPTLPEVALLIADLERAGMARLAGLPGAGKSITILQVAHQMHNRSWEVLRLIDPIGSIAPLRKNSKPTLYIVDDAHLSRPALLRELEEQATASQWVLSAYTISEDKGGLPGAIHLDAKRAVKVIAEGLRASPEKTLAAVRRADDRVGSRTGDERLDLRLEQAAREALYPWQFCFILGGGWRRANAMASSARAVGADIVLAIAAIRQLATRDARCSQDALLALAKDSLASTDINAAITWLTTQRFLLGSEDLRCPHQRLAAVLLRQILQGQSPETRQYIAYIIKTVLSDGAMPLSGLANLLDELSTPAGNTYWSWLVQPEWLRPVLARCWAANEPISIRHACWVLHKLHKYLPDEMAEISNHKETLAKWIETAPEGACYAIGFVINHVFNTNETLGASVIALVDPRTLAQAISNAAPLHAGEIANLISMMHAGRNEDWKTTYLGHINRDACYNIVSTWPEDAYLSIVADYCQHFSFFEPEFGYKLIETLIPTIANRLRADPQDAFHELNDIVWHTLRLYDPLQIYKGKLAPTSRMHQLGRKICACWSPQDLAAKLSLSAQRNFQSAAGLLSFMSKTSPKQFETTVLALDWNRIDEAIGADWEENIGDARMLLGVAYAVPAARSAIQEVIARNEPRIIKMSTHTAALAPASALRHLRAGKHILLCHWGHVDWDLGAFVLAKIIQTEPGLISAFIKPYYRELAEALSQPSPSFYDESLSFIRLLTQFRPIDLTKVLDEINIEKANLGWRNALRGLEVNREPHAKAQIRQAISLLIQYALDRTDAVGELARELRHNFPSKSVPLAKTIEPFDLAEQLE